ncbi:MAG TPA: TrkA family potassium uptake protein [Flexilinea sp.]|jgi:trk system potassium uptake protein TrkA|nr:TrkA family potassium uptake protein [Flexilinea sp.]HOW07646.1 TrkA family potassium uptake protein [Flexilinea sp.]HPS48639.1 TrkA family potassium uptake protein [Flexilinea sp.]HQN63226.1 TrkA family potassium uptake protein [Flexilinea sp.]
MNAIVVGGGNVGIYITRLLRENGNQVKIIDYNETITKKLEAEFGKENVFLGNGSNPAVLERTGIEKADVLLAVTGADEANLAVGTLAKYEFGVRKVIGKVNNPLNAWLYTKQFGIDMVINQAELISKIAMEQIDFEDMTILLRLSEEKYSIVQFEIKGNSPSVGKCISDLDLPEESLVISVSRNKKLQICKGNTMLQAGDHLIALVKDSVNEEFKKHFQ